MGHGVSFVCFGGKIRLDLVGFFVLSSNFTDHRPSSTTMLYATLGLKSIADIGNFNAKFETFINYIFRVIDISIRALFEVRFKAIGEGAASKKSR